MRNLNRERAFSLVELMVIVMIVSILIGISVPSFLTMMQNYRVSTAANALFLAVNVARSEAIHRGSRVDLIPAGRGADWTEGWVVFIDGDNDQRVDEGEIILHAHGAVDSNMVITPRFTDSKAQYIAFNGTGRTRTNGSSHTSQSGSWLLKSGEQSRKVVINFLGRPRTCNPVRDEANC